MRSRIFRVRLAGCVLALACAGAWRGLAGAQQKISVEQSNAAARLYNQGRESYLRGMVDEAIALYRQALAIDPANSDALTNLGLALDGQGKSDEAIADYTLALKFKPHDPVALSDFGLALYHEKKYQEAADTYQ